MIQYLITEGSVFNHQGENLRLKSRGLVTAVAENEKGDDVTLTKEDCVELFKELLVG